MEHRISESRKALLEAQINKKFGFITVTGVGYSDVNECHGLTFVCDCGRTGIETLPKLLKSQRLSCGVIGCPHRAKVQQRNGRKSAFTGCGEIYGCRWAQWRLGAKRRKIEFKVTVEYAWVLFLKQERRCALSGLPLEFGTSWNRQCTASLDRIDSSKGYIEGNVQWVHKRINMMKGDSSEEEFVKLCKLICEKNQNPY